ncbi:MAG: glycosyltransferase [Saprospiraceae bacterium]|nr:glycosyltransferase [Saprospiraceae bacterium]MDW8229807.1 glycosyltransferase [Saprospiraceae bacterium]
MARIALTVTNDLTYDQRMQRIAGALTRAGHSVVLIGRQLPESAPLPARSFEQRRLRCWFRRGPLFYMEYNVRLFIFLLRLSVDAIGAVDLDTLLAACAAARLRRKALVFDAHEYFTETPEVTDRPVVKWVWEAVARLCLPFCRRAYTVGPALADIFTRKYGLPFEVVRNVPEATPLPKAPPAVPPYVLLYQGALNEGRGLEAMLQALTRLDDCELWLAGEGDLSASLRRLAQELHLGPRVRFLGRLTPEVLRALTPNAWLGVNVLEKKGLSYYYSLANKFFDYVQAGVPVLTMNFPEYRALNAQHPVACLLDDLSPEAVVEAVRHLQQHPEEYEALRQATLRARLEWTWEREEARLLALWAEAFA